MSDLKNLLEHATLRDIGVCVQSSSLGSLEALLAFLADQKIPVCGINIGPIHLKDVKKAMVMLEHDPMYSVILGFDVKVHKDAQLLADQVFFFSFILFFFFSFSFFLLSCFNWNC